MIIKVTISQGCCHKHHQGMTKMSKASPQRFMGAATNAISIQLKKLKAHNVNTPTKKQDDALANTGPPLLVASNSRGSGESILHQPRTRFSLRGREAVSNFG